MDVFSTEVLFKLTHAGNQAGTREPKLLAGDFHACLPSISPAFLPLFKRLPIPKSRQPDNP